MGLDKSVSADQVWGLMRPFVGRLHEQVDELNRRVMPAPRRPRRGAVSAQELNVLKTLADSPFLHFSALRERTELFDTLDEIMQRLAGMKLLFPSKGVTKTRPATYYPLTDKAYDLLKVPSSGRIQPQFFHHTMWCHWVRKSLEKEGRAVVSEFGKRDVPGRIDVYCQDTDAAYEISRNFKNVAENALKCLEGFNAKKLVVVCESIKASKRAKAELERRLPPELLGRVEYVSIRSFL